MGEKDYKEEKEQWKPLVLVSSVQGIKRFQSLFCVHACEHFKTKFKNLPELSRNNG